MNIPVTKNKLNLIYKSLPLTLHSAIYLLSNSIKMLRAKESSGLDAMLHRRPASTLGRFFESPAATLATGLYDGRSVQPQTGAIPVRVVCISDTHNQTPKIGDGDILIHAGDLTQLGTVDEIQAQLDWLKILPHEHKIVIAGNHDAAFQSDDKAKLNWDGLHYLEDNSV